MSKLSVSVFLVTGAAITVLAATGPQIRFAESVHDFGRLEYGRIVTNFFVFTNTGDQSLQLSEVISSCGCVAAQNWDRRVEPGKTGTIPVIFSASGIGDYVMKPIRIVCNDPVDSNVVVYVQAQIYKPIDAVPPVAVFSFGPDFQTNETRTIQLISNLTEPVTLSDPLCTNKSFRATLKTVTPGKEFELSVTVMPPLGPGSLVAPITVKSSSPKMPEVKVSAYAMVQPALTVIPGAAQLPPTPLTNNTQLTVTIQNNGTNALSLSEPAIDVDQARLKLVEVQPGRVFQLTMTFPAGFRCEPGQTFAARVKSNNPQSPILKIRVYEPLADPDNTPAK
jgi:hypothetical protein